MIEIDVKSFSTEWLKPTETPEKDYYWFLNESVYPPRSWHYNGLRTKCYNAELVSYPNGKPLSYTESYFKSISYYTKADLTPNWIKWDETNFPKKGHYLLKDYNEKPNYFSAPLNRPVADEFSKVTPPPFFIEEDGTKTPIINISDL